MMTRQNGGLPSSPVRLWMQAHANSWETWVAELPDGIFVAWACLGGENASSFTLEDCFEHAAAAAAFELKRRSGHAECDLACGAWAEREGLDLQHECISAEKR